MLPENLSIVFQIENLFSVDRKQSNIGQCLTVPQGNAKLKIIYKKNNLWRAFIQILR